MQQSARGDSSEIISGAVEIRRARRVLDVAELADREQVADYMIAFGETEAERRHGLIILELVMHIKAVTKGDQRSNKR